MNSSFNWDSLIWDINNNNIVPVLGNDLSMVRFLKTDFSGSPNFKAFIELGVEDGAYVRFNLYQYLAIKLWEIRGSGEPPEKFTLNNVVLQLYDQNVAENQINKVIKDVVAQLTDDQIVMEPFRQLARMPGFDTILTVNLDNFLLRAFQSENKHVNTPINYSIPRMAVDQTESYDKALVRIYNLMGNINGSNFALTEEQSLEYLFMLQNGINSMAKDLFDSIQDKSILLIGCSFPNWFMRFFIRIVAKERFKNGVKTKYVACDHTLKDLELSYFLKKNATEIIQIDDDTKSEKYDESYNNSMEFIDELYHKWKEKSGTSVNQVRYKEKLFLSYSWDDKPIVEKLKNEFEKNGVSVFFDDDELKTGDKFNLVIKKNIKECEYFLPIISKNAILDQTRYVYAKEWNAAIVLNDFGDSPNICPYIIDDTPATDPRIPENLRELNIRTLSTVEEFGEMVRKFIQENNLSTIEA